MTSMPIKINYEFVNRLNQKGGEGSTLYAQGMGSGPHLEYKIKWLNQIKPTKLLETGTNKAQFCYIVKLLFPNCKITTLDVHEWCQDMVNMVLQETSTEGINFIQGNTLHTMKSIDESFDCAWIDGDHSYEVCLSDLRECNRLGIPHLLIDDWTFCADVTTAVMDFVNETKYKIIGVSMDSPGIVELKLIQ